MLTPSGNTKSITFELDTDRQLNDARDVTITIGYSVVTKAEADKDPVISEVASRSLTLDIHMCVEIADCP